LTLTIYQRPSSEKNDKANEPNVVDGEPPQATVLETTEMAPAPETKYLSGLPLHLLGLAMMSSIFMIALDLSIISMWNTSALPTRSDSTNKLSKPLRSPKSQPVSTAWMTWVRDPFHTGYPEIDQSYRMVWERLSPRPDGPTTMLRQDLHLLRT